MSAHNRLQATPAALGTGARILLANAALALASPASLAGVDTLYCDAEQQTKIDFAHGYVSKYYEAIIKASCINFPNEAECDPTTLIPAAEHELNRAVVFCSSTDHSYINSDNREVHFWGYANFAWEGADPNEALNEAEDEHAWLYGTDVWWMAPAGSVVLFPRMFNSPETATNGLPCNTVYIFAHEYLGHMAKRTLHMLKENGDVNYKDWQYEMGYTAEALCLAEKTSTIPTLLTVDLQLAAEPFDPVPSPPSSPHHPPKVYVTSTREHIGIFAQTTALQLQQAA